MSHIHFYPYEYLTIPTNESVIQLPYYYISLTSLIIPKIYSIYKWLNIFIHISLTKVS